MLTRLRWIRRGARRRADSYVSEAVGIVPILNTGIASKKPGVGQIGAGIQPAPMACFEAAWRALSPP